MATNALVCLGPVQRGRPAGDTYADDVANEICERIASGELLQDICSSRDMPSARTVSRWLLNHPEFYVRYASARETQQHLETEEIRRIADDKSIEPDHKRIMIDARKWRAERLAKRFYAPAVKHEHTVDPGTPAGQELLPPSLGFLAGKLPKPDPAG